MKFIATITSNRIKSIPYEMHQVFDESACLIDVWKWAWEAIDPVSVDILEIINGSIPTRLTIQWIQE